MAVAVLHFTLLRTYV